jgi:acetate kinase
MTAASPILVLNTGSSSIKFMLHDGAASLIRGLVDGIGGDMPRLVIRNGDVMADEGLTNGEAADHDRALATLVARLGQSIPDLRVAAVGHRIVHGGPDFRDPVIVDEEVLVSLTELVPLAPLHQPQNIAGIRAAQLAFPGALQVACFDTAFHRGHERVEETYALPRRYYEAGVRRYGFHGLSYEYIAGALVKIAPKVARGRVIVAHLGNGASLCALKNGRSVASTMGLSALDGLPMGTRCGQIDPGVLLYLMQAEGLDVAALSDLLYRQSGLLGLSGLSADMRVLEASGTAEADFAIAYFTARIRREIGALAANLGGLDALVFTAGIGEHSSRIRHEVCEGLGFFGVTLDADANAAHAQVISATDAAVPVLRVPTDEEAVIVEHTLRLATG